MWTVGPAVFSVFTFSAGCRVWWVASRRCQHFSKTSEEPQTPQGVLRTLVSRRRDSSWGLRVKDVLGWPEERKEFSPKEEVHLLSLEGGESQGLQKKVAHGPQCLSLSLWKHWLFAADFPAAPGALGARLRGSFQKCQSCPPSPLGRFPSRGVTSANEQLCQAASAVQASPDRSLWTSLPPAAASGGFDLSAPPLP